MIQWNQELLISRPILLAILRSFDHRFLRLKEHRKRLWNQNTQPSSHLAPIFQPDRTQNRRYLDRSCTRSHTPFTIVFYDLKNLGNDPKFNRFRPKLNSGRFSSIRMNHWNRGKYFSPSATPCIPSPPGSLSSRLAALRCIRSAWPFPWLIFSGRGLPLIHVAHFPR